MNTLDILQAALTTSLNNSKLDKNAKPLITPNRAIKIANFRLGGKWIVTADTNRLYDLEDGNIFYTDLDDKYHETTRMLQKVFRGIGSAFYWVSKRKLALNKYSDTIKQCRLSFNYFEISYTTFVTVDNLDVARDYCVDRQLIYRWSDGIYHREMEPVARIVAGYHSIRRPEWWKTTEGIGMELEIYSNDPNKLNEKLPADILAERDGSLHSTAGIELIGGPYTCKDYQEGKTPWNEVVEKAKEIGGKGYHAGDGYGIHLSLSASLFTSLHGAKFVVFFNQQKELSQLVAQREVIYNGGYGVRKTVASTVYYKNDYYTKNRMQQHLNNNAHKMVGNARKEYALETNKYEPVKVDSKRYEVRIFRSNLQWERILKNIEYVEAVKNYTKDGSVVSIATPYTGTVDFLYWLGKQSGYSHLKKFLVDNARFFTDRANKEDFIAKTKFKLKQKLENTPDY